MKFEDATEEIIKSIDISPKDISDVIRTVGLSNYNYLFVFSILNENNRKDMPVFGSVYTYINYGDIFIWHFIYVSLRSSMSD